jgi:uncharacterized protein with PQ loop repeat
MYLAPMPSIQAALRAGTLGDINPLPFPSLVAACFAWIAYGLIIKVRSHSSCRSVNSKNSSLHVNNIIYAKTKSWEMKMSK